MYRIVTKDEFCEELSGCFSSIGAEVLYDYLVELEEDTRELVRFDPVGLRCEYTEYSNLEEFQRDYDKDRFPTIESIQDAAIVLMTDEGGFVVCTDSL